MKSLNLRFRFPAAIGALFCCAAIAAMLHAEEKAKEPAVSASALAEPVVTAPASVDPKLKEALKLTDEQWPQFEAILLEKETRNRGELERHFAAQRVISSETDAKLAAVLTEEQVTAYFATERKGSMDRLNSIAAEIRKRRDLRQQGKEPADKK